MEESKSIPEDNASIESSSEIKNKSNNEDNIEAFSEFLEKVSNQGDSDNKVDLNLKEEKINNDNSLFKRILNNGFDGISSNPNYKMLALLVILLVNLSLFFIIGNIGKGFLTKAGIMW